MQVVYERCCGLDVHKKSIVACLLVWQPQAGWDKQIRTFGTMTQDILALADWLEAAGCSHVAMESTGVYWKPIYNLLEGRFELLVVNAQHMPRKTGHKTDVQDAEWIADLLRHGLLKPSFIPSAAEREWRDLTRYRTTLVRERAQVINRLQKVLEDANIKLAAVVSDILGVSARAMLDALLAGQTDPEVLAELAHGRLQSKREQLERALEGRVKPHHRFLLVEQLSQIDYLEQAIDRVSAEIAQRLEPFDTHLQRLDTIPGVGRRTAEILLAEIGTDLSRFPSAKHLASWAGMCPGNNESAGKRKSGKTRKGSPWLRQALVEAAHGAARSKKTYLAARYHRLVRKGRNKAFMAVGHDILVIAYYVLSRDEDYHDLGPNYYDERDRQAVQRKLTRRLEQLGYEVTLKPKAQAVRETFSG